MATPKSGHSAIIAIQKEGDPSGTLTAVAWLKGDIGWGTSRGISDQTPRGDTAPYFVLDPVMGIDPLTFGGLYIHDDATQDEATGLLKAYHDGTTIEFQYRGPSHAADTDELEGEAFVINFKVTAGMRENPYMFECTMQPTGTFDINGVTYGTTSAS